VYHTGTGHQKFWALAEHAPSTAQLPACCRAQILQVPSYDASAGDAVTKARHHLHLADKLLDVTCECVLSRYNMNSTALKSDTMRHHRSL
jgi:hypothetical protein